MTTNSANPGSRSADADAKVGSTGSTIETVEPSRASASSPVRQLFESALRDGPLFRPEGVVADKVSETAGEAAAQKYLAKAKGSTDPDDPVSQTGGWIFVAGSANRGSHLRIAVSERHRTENAANFETKQLAHHLGLDPDETLRYAAYSHDAYRALATARKALSVFETDDRRYHCPSAVAATAIESLRETISSRKTNFETVKSAPTETSSFNQSGTLKASLPQLLIEDDRRVERHAAISSLMQETEKSLSEATEMLDGVTTTKRRPQVRRQLPGVIWRRGRRQPNTHQPRVSAESSPKLASRGVLTAPVVQTMEQAIMRREASQYLTARRVEMKRLMFTTFSLVSFVCALALVFLQHSPIGIAIVWALTLGIVTSLAVHLLIKRRYAKPTIVWKEILERPVTAPR